MSSKEKLLQAVLSGQGYKNFRFSDLQTLLSALGFKMRIRGDHYIFSREEIPEILNLQPKDGMGKPYQIRQLREIIVKYGLEV